VDAPPSPPAAIDDLVERFDHVSVAVSDIRSALPLVEIMGGRLRSGGVNPAGFRWAQWYLPGSGKLEIVAPLDPDDKSHFLVRFLATRGPGLHHLTFKVRNIETAIARARDAGYDVVGVNLARETWKEAFLHPTSASGVLVQLAEFTDREPPSGITIDDVLGVPGT
jgi:catechol 2,3-dioxygenase-like lactoylglutathione lyase family enzyme